MPGFNFIGLDVEIKGLFYYNSGVIVLVPEFAYILAKENVDYNLIILRNITNIDLVFPRPTCLICQKLSRWSCSH